MKHTVLVPSFYFLTKRRYCTGIIHVMLDLTLRVLRQVLNK